MSGGTAARNTKVYMTGTSTAATDEATTANSGTEFQITNTARRIMDPDPANTPVVKVNGSAVTPSAYELNLLFGVVTFTADQTGNTVTVTYSYLPRHKIVDCRAADWNPSFETADVTVFEDTGRRRLATLIDIEVGLERTAIGNDVLDGSALTVDKVLFDQTPKVLEVDPRGDGTRAYRAWCLIASNSQSVPADGALSSSPSAVGAQPATGKMIEYGVAS